MELRKQSLVLWLTGCVLLVGSSPAAAQQPVRVTAVAGQPYGVARLELPATLLGAMASGRAVEVITDDRRALFPVTRDVMAPAADPPPLQPLPPGRAIGGGRLLNRIGNAIRNATAEQQDRTVGHEVLFLFRGEQPFEARLAGAAASRLRIVPQQVSEAEHRLVLEQWWDAYAQQTRRQIDSGDYPPLVESYLLSMLGSRLNLSPTVVDPDPSIDDSDQIASTLELIGGSEKLRTAILRRAAAGDTEQAQTVTVPVPAGPDWAPPVVRAPEQAPAIEPMAQRVPPECFYLRFGSFLNYLWFRDLSNQYGGDLTRMVTLRGLDDGGNQRIETQLNLTTSEISRLLGSEVIEDQAIIGTDLFLSEGASLGVLFRAKNAFLLNNSLRRERATAARVTPGAVLQDQQIAGQTVSFLSTPDNRLRSFLAVDGEWFFVTNSRTLVERFYEVGDGATSLGQTPEFQLARTLMTVDRDDTVFAYFSPAMLRQLVGPQYQIELRRRLYAGADIALVHLARLAARVDGREIDAINPLVEAGYLPVGFGQRPDASGPIVVGEEVVDARRGARGSFLPIADVQLTAVTPEEAAWYRRRADFYSDNWQQIDPIMVGMRRSQVAGFPQRQRLEVHAEIAPLVPEKYGAIARQLGPPTRTAIRFAPDDIAAVQAHVVSDQLAGTIPPHHLFAAIKDSRPPNPDSLDGFFKTYFALRVLPGYIGAWPEPGLLDRLPLGLGQGTPVGPGMSRLLGGLYRYQAGGFSVVSFQPETLTSSVPHMAAIEVEDQAQVRLHVGNLDGSRLEGWVNDQLFERDQQTSIAGAHFLTALTRQLKVPAEAAPQVTERLLSARLQCPLGGQYILVEQLGADTWVSTAWDAGRPHATAPASYQAPLLTWFRGAHANLTQYPDRLVLDATIDMHHAGLAVPAASITPPAEDGRPGPEQN